MARRAVAGLPKVAHFTVAPEFVDRIMVHDLRRLRDREDITIICADGAAVSGIRAEGFRVIVVNAERKIRPFADLRTLWTLWRLFRREQFDLLHSYTPKAGLLGQIAGWLAGIPRRVHGCRGLLYSPTMRPWQRRIFRATDWITNRLAHLTLYLSSADLRYSVDEGLCDARKARFIGSGIDLSRFTRSADVEREGAAWREQLGIAADDTVVMTVGRYVADKGYAEVATAAANLRAEFPRARYVWVAPVFAGEDGVLPDDLPRRAGVGDLVQRIGYVENIAPLLVAADVIVHPSHREGVPRVLLEAAALGTPLVASDIPGCREVIRNESEGLLFPAHDADGLARALRAALSDPRATRARAERAQASVRERFDQDALTRRVWDVHHALFTAGASLLLSGGAS